METTDVGDGVTRPRSILREPGELIGPYTVERTIGAGAMGVVYAAFEPGTLRRIAVKLLHPREYYGAGSGRAAEAWLRNEAAALSRLDHANVVRVYGVGTDGSRCYMAMEYVEGQTLGAWLEAAPRDWHEVLRVCIEAGRGLAAAHAAGLVHGDFKPDNVMVAADGRVLVMDFGLSRTMTRRARASTETALPAIRLPSDDELPTASHAAVSDSAETLTDEEAFRDEPPDERPAAPPADDETTMSLELEPDAPTGPSPREGSRLRRHPGTPAYMAPELLAGQGGDARSDQFSLCVTMYKALYGRRPYGGRTPGEIAYRLGRGDLRPAPRGSRVPIWVHATVTRGLAIDPRDRWRSVTTLLRALQAHLGRYDRCRNTIVLACTGLAIVAILVLQRFLAA